MFEQKDVSFLTYLALPFIIFLGWMIYVSWIFGIEGRWLLILILGITVYLLFGFSKKITIKKEDLRWLIAPVMIVFISVYLRWWDYTQAWDDASVHLFQSLNFVGDSDWIPPLGMGYRSPTIPGVLAFEFLFDKNPNQIFMIPLLLFVASSWQIQHFSERFCSKKTAAICVCFFILLPTVRYWGQMAMTDVAVTGMWFFCMSLLIYSEQNLMENKITILLGVCVGLLFLTKYTFIYLLGLIFWLRMKDGNLYRIKLFFIGWFLICLPFLLHQTITQGNPLYPLMNQLNFTAKSAISTADSYTTYSFIEEIILDVNIFLLICSFFGACILFSKSKKEFTVISIFGIPLLILNGIILDWGEPRYNIPLITLGVILFMRCIEQNESNIFIKRIKWFPYLCSGIILTSLALHIVDLPSERERSLVANENFDSWSSFEMTAIQDLDDDSILLAGRAMSISLLSEIRTIRFDNPYGKSDVNLSEDKILHPVNIHDATHVLTTNVAPFFGWEKDFDWQLGHSDIELEKIHIDGWWSAALWAVDNKSYYSPAKYYSNYSGKITGDLMILEPGQSLTIGDSNLSLKWIEVTSIRPSQQIMRALSGDLTVMINGSLDQGNDSLFYSGQTINATQNYIYIWINDII